MTVFVPVQTSAAGSCLTGKNWEDIGVNTLSFHLDALLVKPGATLLSKAMNLAAYTGWQGASVLNASMLCFNKSDVCVVRSAYDGSLVRIEKEAVLALINHLQPNMVILPAVLAKEASGALKTMLSFLPIPDSQGFFEAQNGSVFSIYRSSQLPLATYMESDDPAQAGMQGNVYTSEGTIDLGKSDMRHQHQLIDTNCHCSTCSQQLTRAYLHHLLAQAPLLCQRFLIQHNVYHTCRSRGGET